MVKFQARRIAEKDLLAFANELSSALGGGGKDGLAFGIEKKEDGKETIWLFGREIQTVKPEQPQEA